jgi:hypothetical protein
LANIVIALISAGLIDVCGPIAYSLNPLGGYLVAVAAQIPLVSAVATQASLTSANPIQDRYSARRLGVWRLIHYLAMTSVAGVAVGLAASALRVSPESQLSSYSDFGTVAEVRNLLALTGAAFVGVSAFGGAFGWTVPLAWTTLPFVLSRGANSDSTGLLTLVIAPDTAFIPMVAALVTFVVGAALAASAWPVTAVLTSITGVAKRQLRPSAGGRSPSH